MARYRWRLGAGASTEVVKERSNNSISCSLGKKGCFHYSQPIKKDPSFNPSVAVAARGKKGFPLLAAH
jgi:hypothetical protein